jgi:hypothetical protein
MQPVATDWLWQNQWSYSYIPTASIILEAACQESMQHSDQYAETDQEVIQWESGSV